MPNNKKQRGRDSQKKKEAQNAAQKNAEAVVRRAQIEAELQRKFGMPAVDHLITDMAAAAAAVVSKSSSNATTEKDDGVCYHGSSAEYFVAGSEFLKIVKSFVVLSKKYFLDDGSDLDRLQDDIRKLLNDNENQKSMLNMELTNFVYALGVSFYLKLTSEEKEKYRRLQQSLDSRSISEMKKTASCELEFILQLGLTIKYDAIPQMIGEKVDNEKWMKYSRDLVNERGIINGLYRETKNYCDCMKMKKMEANDMDKMDLCHGCCKVFPKARTMVCDGCQAVVYCSKECSITDWPDHKSFCTYVQKNTDAGKINDKYKAQNNNETEKTNNKRHKSFCTYSQKNTEVSKIDGKYTTQNNNETEKTNNKTWVVAAEEAAAEAAALMNRLCISEANEDDQPELDGFVSVKQRRTTSSDRSQQHNNIDNNIRKDDDNDDDNGSGSGSDGGGGSVVGDQKTTNTN